MRFWGTCIFSVWPLWLVMRTLVSQISSATLSSIFHFHSSKKYSLSYDKNIKVSYLNYSLVCMTKILPYFHNYTMFGLLVITQKCLAQKCFVFAQYNTTMVGIVYLRTFVTNIFVRRWFKDSCLHFTTLLCFCDLKCLIFRPEKKIEIVF